MYEFSFDPKEKIVYMTIGAGKARTSFRNGSDIAEWNTLPVEVTDHLQPLRESKKMKENDWISRYFWELPYGEAYEFRKWLEINFRGGKYHFYVETSNGKLIKVSTSYTRNEVGEPFLDCEACLPKNVLIQICDIILREYEKYFEE